MVLIVTMILLKLPHVKIKRLQCYFHWFSEFQQFGQIMRILALLFVISWLGGEMLPPLVWSMWPSITHLHL